MTPDERNMLNDLAGKVAQTPAPPRDPEAEDIIRSKIGSRPDALYLMTQTVLIQNMALQRAQQQIQDLQQRASQGQVTTGGSSWLGQPAGGYAASQQQAAPPAPQYSPATPSAFGGGGGSSFLRGAAQTAAGVAAGTLAAEAIGSMFSSRGGGLFGGNELMGGGMAPTEETVNNYYDSPGNSNAGLGPADDRGDNFADPGNMSNVDDSQYDDNSQLDDARLDTDDGGGFDTGSDDSYV